MTTNAKADRRAARAAAAIGARAFNEMSGITRVAIGYSSPAISNHGLKRKTLKTRPLATEIALSPFLAAFCNFRVASTVIEGHAPEESVKRFAADGAVFVVAHC
jgi:hypothetical protein